MVGNHQTSIYKWLALGFQVSFHGCPEKRSSNFHSSDNLRSTAVSCRRNFVNCSVNIRVITTIRVITYLPTFYIPLLTSWDIQACHNNVWDRNSGFNEFRDSLGGACISPRDGEDLLKVASSIRTGRCWFRGISNTLRRQTFLAHVGYNQEKEIDLADLTNHASHQEQKHSPRRMC